MTHLFAFNNFCIINIKDTNNTVINSRNKNRIEGEFFDLSYTQDVFDDIDCYCQDIIKDYKKVIKYYLKKNRALV